METEKEGRLLSPKKVIYDKDRNEARARDESQVAYGVDDQPRPFTAGRGR